MTQYRVVGLTLDGQASNPQHGSDFAYHPDGQVKYASDLFTDSLVSTDRHRLHDAPTATTSRDGSRRHTRALRPTSS